MNLVAYALLMPVSLAIALLSIKYATGVNPVTTFQQLIGPAIQILNNAGK